MLAADSIRVWKPSGKAVLAADSIAASTSEQENSFWGPESLPTYGLVVSKPPSVGFMLFEHDHGSNIPLVEAALAADWITASDFTNF